MISSTSRWSWAWALFAVLALACADTNSPGNEGGSGGTAGAGGTGGTGGSGGSGGDGGGCEYGGELVIPTDENDTGWEPAVPDALRESLSGDARPASCGEEFGWISKVRGWIAAPGGEPLSCAFAQICIYAASGDYVCLNPALADEDGVYTIDVPEAYRCVDEVAMRTLLPESNRAISYCPVTPGDDAVVRLEVPSVLPFLMPTEDLPEVGDADEAREVAMHDGLTLLVTPSKLSNFEFFGPEVYEQLSGRRVPTDAVGLCGGAEEFDGLYAFHPEDRILGEGFPFTIENETGLPAGTRVEFSVLGGLDCKLADGTSVPEGVWMPFGEGEVSEDGTTIATDEGVGLPCTTWMAYRSKETP